MNATLSHKATGQKPSKEQIQEILQRDRDRWNMFFYGCTGKKAKILQAEHHAQEQARIRQETRREQLADRIFQGITLSILGAIILAFIAAGPVTGILCAMDREPLMGSCPQTPK